MRSLLPASLMIALPAVAFAQAAPATEDVLHAPGFVTLDRLDATSRLGGEVAYLALEGLKLLESLDYHTWPEADRREILADIQWLVDTKPQSKSS